MTNACDLRTLSREKIFTEKARFPAGSGRSDKVVALTSSKQQGLEIRYHWLNMLLLSRYRQPMMPVHITMAAENLFSLGIHPYTHETML